MKLPPVDRPTPREIAEQRATGEIVERFYFLAQASADVERFTDRLVHILTRLEVYKASVLPMPKTVMRAQVRKLEKSATNFLAAIEDLSDPAAEFLHGQLEHEDRRKYVDWDFWGDTPQPEDNQTVEQASFAASRILRASRVALAAINSLPDKAHRKTYTGLEQFIVDIGSLYRYGDTDRSFRDCYYDASKDDYSGGMFYLISDALDYFHPQHRLSRVALGKKIIRLHKD